jgi:hypothetical protein
MSGENSQFFFAPVPADIHRDTRQPDKLLRQLREIFPHRARAVPVPHRLLHALVQKRNLDLSRRGF